MKHLTKILVLLLLISPFQVSARDLSGHILLQVEQHGEAWYINPTNGNRYYMKDGNTAYEMMRSFGLGITDSDLENIPAVSNVEEMKSADSQCDNDLAKKQSGKILLQVQQHGEAWWVYPDKCLRIYLKNGEEAYIIMRFLGLGITNNDLFEIDFANVEANSKEASTKDEGFFENSDIAVPPTQVIEKSELPDYIKNDLDYGALSLDAVALLICANPYYPDSLFTGSGTFFMIDDYVTVVTNSHVLQESAETDCIVVANHDQKMYHGYVSYISPTLDLAYLNIDYKFDSAGNALDLQDSDQVYYLDIYESCNLDNVNYGDKLVVVGYPAVGDYTLNVTEGIVSGFDSEGYIKTSAKIEHGNSGGAAFHYSGCWLGIPTAAQVGLIESIGRILPITWQ